MEESDLSTLICISENHFNTFYLNPCEAEFILGNIEYIHISIFFNTEMILKDEMLCESKGLGDPAYHCC